jgi:ATP-dependent RNA helicase RhlE
VAQRASAPFDPAPLSFKSLVTEPALLDALEQRGYVQTTPIQSAVLPYALAGRDVIGCAETGTGKTAAYVLPVLSRLIREDREAGPRAFTRRDPRADSGTDARARHADRRRDSGLRVSRAGRERGRVRRRADGPQERSLKAGVDIVVATPGRLLDHMRSNVGDFSKLEIFVLDEADRMMDMGFWPDVRKIAEALPPSSARQTMLFSATMPEEVMRFATRWRPRRCSCRWDRDEDPPRRLRMRRAFCPLATRPCSWPSTCAGTPNRRSSSSTRRSAATGWPSSCRERPARGRGPRDRSQEDRTAAIESFRAGRTKVLVATDVAARGLDIDDVTLIVNYEVPHGLDSYVHRVGRTGRNESKGHALTLADPAEREIWSWWKRRSG